MNERLILEKSKISKKLIKANLKVESLKEWIINLTKTIDSQKEINNQ